MNQYKFLVLSDLHIGKSEEANNSTRLTIETPDFPINENPFESLKAFIEDKKMSFDCIFNLGDLANRGLVAGLNMGMKMLRELSMRYNCPLVNTPGNHDYCYDYTKGAINLLKCTRDFPTDNISSNSDFWSNGFCLYKIKNVNILICNSGKDFEKKEDMNTIPVFDELYCSTLDNYLNKNLNEGIIHIAIVHHHVLQHSDVIENAEYGSNDIIDHADNFLAVLRKYHFCCVLHGHKHLSRFTIKDNMAIMACGSLSALDNVRICDEKNYFHVLTLSDENDTPSGIIDSYYYMPKKGWLEIVDKNFSIDAKYGFGYKFDIAAIAEKLSGFIIEGTPCKEIDDYSLLIPELNLMTEKERTELEKTLSLEGISYVVNNKKLVIYRK